MPRFTGRLAGKAWNGRWRGQRQKWFAMRFKGIDSDIEIDRHEFDDWKWVRIEELTDLVVPFKREIYVSVLSEFHDDEYPLDIEALRVIQPKLDEQVGLQATA